MTILHENKNYKVVLIEVEDVDSPYHVINISNDIVEYYADNLPQALVIAEQFNDMLDKQVHLQYRSSFQVVSEDDEDETNGNVSPIIQ